MAPSFISLEKGTDVSIEHFGLRAHTLVTLIDAGFPVSHCFGISDEAVADFTRGDGPTDLPFLEGMNQGVLYSLRVSPSSRSWGGPDTLLNIGMNDRARDLYAKTMGADRANALYFRFIQDYAVNVARLDEEDFQLILSRHTDGDKVDYNGVIEASLAWYEAELDAEFPQDPRDQFTAAAAAMGKAWGGTTARILREAKGAPAGVGLPLIAQEMVLGVGDGECGAGFGQMLLPATGEEIAFGRYARQGQGLDAAIAGSDALFLGRDDRGPSLETVCPDAFEMFKENAAHARAVFRDDMRIDFTIQDGALWVLDAVRAERSGRASVAASVRLAEDGIKSRHEALLSLDPRSLNEVLHPQIDPKATRDVVARGIAASPGAATGKIVFSANAAQVTAARGENCILVRVETTPEDIRGMHSALGILTERGGANSHAAVVARGLGLPCVVGATEITIDRREKTLTLADGRVLAENTIITLDGAAGEAMIGAPKLVEPDLSGAFDTFMSWADEVRTLKVRANADTPGDARMARGFGVDGIGLCRTEHMFFDEGRLAVMRELIFAEDASAREDALNLLMPMQQADFEELFEIMEGLPVCIRLLDPPLHEFLPRSREEISEVATEMDLPISTVNARIEELSEFNPMLGMRGVRLGISFPEIYEMQARAIFEACASVQKRTGVTLDPEIMVPLVSANREVEMVKASVEAVAASVRASSGQDLKYDLGVMVETPRAALRAGDIAHSSEFFSFGTNDLTQMTYGLSRDDAGRFMSEYVAHDVFPEDPFHTLDTEGVGELMLHAVDRGRAVKDGLKIGLCGEHGGDPVSVAFCCSAGFDYVSCSPFRTPIARLAAAQAEILDDSKGKAG